MSRLKRELIIVCVKLQRHAEGGLKQDKEDASQELWEVCDKQEIQWRYHACVLFTPPNDLTLYFFVRRWRQRQHRKVQRRELGRWRWKPTRHQVHRLFLSFSPSLSDVYLRDYYITENLFQDQGVSREWPDWFKIWIWPTHNGREDRLPHQYACLRGRYIVLLLLNCMLSSMKELQPQVLDEDRRLLGAVDYYFIEEDGARCKLAIT